MLIKKVTSFIFLVSISMTSGVVFAGGGGGGGATEATQVINNIELRSIEQNTDQTASAVGELSSFQTVKGPVANGLIASTLQNSADIILTWVNGGFSGEPLIKNPESYIKEQGLNEVRKTLKAVPEGGVFSGAIFNAMLGSQQEKDPYERVKELSQSSIPSIVQNNLCSEENLTRRAIDRIADTNGSYDSTRLAEEKKVLYDYACNGDPSVDEALSSKLMDLYRQDTSLGGIEAFYAITAGGENNVSRSFLAAEELNSRVAEKENLAARELFDGLQAVSDKKCLKEDTDINGGTFCSEEAILTPGDSVQYALNLASTASFQRLFNVIGEGSGFQTLAGFSADSLLKGLNAGVSKMTSTTETNSSVTPGREDFFGDTNKKNTYISNITKQLDADNKILTDLQLVDAEYLKQVNAYEARVNSMKFCYDSLVMNGSLQRESSSFMSADTFYKTQKSRLDAVKAVISRDAVKISEASALITDTKQRLNASKGTDEVGLIFSNYSSQREQKELPDQSTVAARQKTFLKDKEDAARDTTPEDKLLTCQQTGGVTTTGPAEIGGY